jgi:aryl-alcohol dehydrogenase-like predicted oxidoreductase
MRERVVVPGLTVSAVGVGCNNFGWRLDAPAAQAVVDEAIGVGITLFDTAESYGDGESEEFLGRAIAGRRDRVVIATKFGWGKGFADASLARGHPDYVRSAIEGSLQRLGTDYVDLYQYHRPDGVTPVEETLGAMDELVQQGKVRFIGSSNFSAAQVEEADAVAAERGLARFVTAQNRYSWLERGAEDELIPALERLGVALIPYFPLASGLLTGKYRRGAPEPEGTRLSGRLEVSDEQWSRIEALDAFAAARSLTLLDVAIGGLAAQPTVCSVIAGAMTPAQVRANAAAVAWEPSSAELDELRAL